MVLTDFYLWPRVQSLLRIVGGFKDQEKRLASMEAQVNLEKWPTTTPFDT